MLVADLANKVDEVIRLFNVVPVVKANERMRLVDKFRRATVARMLDEGLSYGQASSAPSVS